MEINSNLFSRCFLSRDAQHDLYHIGFCFCCSETTLAFFFGKVKGLQKPTDRSAAGTPTMGSDRRALHRKFQRLTKVGEIQGNWWGQEYLEFLTTWYTSIWSYHFSTTEIDL